MLVKVKELSEKINMVKHTAKDQPFESDLAPALLFTDSKIIAVGNSYMSVKFNHGLDNKNINLDNITQLISKLNPEAEIDISSPSGDIVYIKYKIGRNKTSRIKLATTERDPIDIIKPHKDRKPLPEGFQNGLKMCQVSLPSNTLRKEYNCYKIAEKSIMTTDGIKLCVFSLNEEISDGIVIIADTTIQPILENAINQFSASSNYIDFYGEDTVIRVPILNDEKMGPPVNEEIFKFEEIISIDRSMLIKDMETASIFGKGSYEGDLSVSFQINKKQYIIRSKNEMGQISTRGSLKSDIKATMIINPSYLEQGLKLFDKDILQIGIMKLYQNYKLVIREDNKSFVMISYIDRSIKNEED